MQPSMWACRGRGEEVKEMVVLLPEERVGHACWSSYGGACRRGRKRPQPAGAWSAWLVPSQMGAARLRDRDEPLRTLCLRRAHDNPHGHLRRPAEVAPQHG